MYVKAHGFMFLVDSEGGVFHSKKSLYPGFQLCIPVYAVISDKWNFPLWKKKRREKKRHRIRSREWNVSIIRQRERRTGQLVRSFVCRACLFGIMVNATHTHTENMYNICILLVLNKNKEKREKGKNCDAMSEKRCSKIQFPVWCVTPLATWHVAGTLQTRVYTIAATTTITIMIITTTITRFV